MGQTPSAQNPRVDVPTDVSRDQRTVVAAGGPSRTQPRALARTGSDALFQLALALLALLLGSTLLRFARHEAQPVYRVARHHRRPPPTIHLQRGQTAPGWARRRE